MPVRASGGLLMRGVGEDPASRKGLQRSSCNPSIGGLILRLQSGRVRL
jgi:hypothetical protein